MINKELRIGNWVKAPLGEIMQVKILGHQENPDYILAECKEGFGQNGFEGIELTPEILEKCGWVKSDDYWVRTWGTNGAEFLEWDEYYQSFKLQLGKGRSIVIKSLHQLQNVFWCLCGEELNYQP